MHESAFKFKKKRIHLARLQKINNNLEIHIKDTIISIPQEDQKIILKGFMQKQPPSVFNKGSVQIKN